MYLQNCTHRWASWWSYPETLLFSRGWTGGWHSARNHCPPSPVLAQHPWCWLLHITASCGDKQILPATLQKKVRLLSLNLPPPYGFYSARSGPSDGAVSSMMAVVIVRRYSELKSIIKSFLIKQVLYMLSHPVRLAVRYRLLSTYILVGGHYHMVFDPILMLW